MSISGALAKSLAAGRPQFNARVAAFRRAQGGFDEEIFSAILASLLDPVVASVDAVAPERSGAATEAGFDIALTLAARRLAGPGSRRDVVDRLWRDVLPALAPAIAERPRALIGGLTNAVINIAGTPGARAGEWLDLMKAAASMATAETLPAMGQVLAWRSGMSHYREGALNAAGTLPAETALALFGAKGEWSKLHARLLVDRWWRPDGVVQPGEAVIGGFTGFGGPFPQPPRVRVGAEGFVVRSSDRTFLLIADAYGATLHVTTPESFDALVDRPIAATANGVKVGDHTVPLTTPLHGISAASDETAVVIASDYSHELRVLPWRHP